MVSHFSKTNFLLILLTGLFFQTVQTFASAGVLIEKEASVDTVVVALNEPEQKRRLSEISRNIFDRDVGKPYIQQKMCTHEIGIVEKWRLYEKEKPNRLTRDQWKSILQRGRLVVFTIDDPSQLISEKIGSPDSILVKKMPGTSSAIVIELTLNELGAIGRSYTDSEFPAFSGRKKAGTQGFTEKVLTQIKLLFDISDIVAQISLDGSLDIDFSELGKISTICPK